MTIIGALKVCAQKVCALKVCALKVSAQKVCAQKVSPLMVRLGTLVVAGAFVAACTQPSPLPPSVPSTMVLIEQSVVTRPPDSHDVALPPLEGTGPTSTIAFATGTVSIGGKVVGPDGPVDGATVRIQRIVDDQTAETTVQTDAAGAWKLTGVTGGIVRLQAYRAPDLALPESAVVFASGTTKVDLTLEKFDGTSLQWALAPSQPIAGRSVNLVVQVSVKRVDTDGFVRVAPLGGIGVTLVPLGALQPLVVEAPVTDAEGRVTFRLACTTTGSSQVRIQLATGEESTIAPQPCQLPPTTPPPSSIEATLPPVQVPEPTTTLPAN